MLAVFTVKCGYCTSLLSVNMVKASFAPLHLFPSLNQSEYPPEQEMKKESLPEITRGSQKEMDKHNSSHVISSDEEDYDFPSNLIINRPPEKRQRAPSAYNRFIKEEIRRLKDKNPNMTHKQAFSIAAKNWAQFPPSLSKLGEDEAAGGREHGFKLAPRMTGFLIKLFIWFLELRFLKPLLLYILKRENQIHKFVSFVEVEEQPLYAPMHPYEEHKEPETKHLESGLSPSEQVQQVTGCINSTDNHPSFGYNA